MLSALKRVGYVSAGVLLALVAWVHLSGRIWLVTADIGRHIRNGELAWTQHQILATNFFSYAVGEFPAPCHHWGSGVVFFLVWKALGFEGLSMAYAGLLLATTALATWLGARAGSWRAALLATLLALPLIGMRIEIRPEGFTTLLLLASFALLRAQRANWIHERWLWLLPLLQLLWINLHVLFVLGFLQLGLFTVDAWLTDGFGRRFRLLVSVTAISILASLVNPFGLQGLLLPIQIFPSQSSLAEDQSMFLMMRLFPQRTIYLFGIVLIGFSLLLRLVRLGLERDWRRSFLDLALLASFGTLALRANRSIAMFAFLFIPIAAETWQILLGRLPEAWRRWGEGATSLAFATALACATLVPSAVLSPLGKHANALPAQAAWGSHLPHVLTHPELWRGVVPGTTESGEFFRKSGLRGPVFNNFDIGNYFIFALYPTERPFIDNRPEAYPLSFLRDVYTKMQIEEPAWAEMSDKYGFEAIFFYHRDRSPAGQGFLARRLADSAWAPVYVDANVLILAKRGGLNQAIIERHELPASMFRSGAR